MKDENQNQKGGDYSSNIQAKNIVINTGISVSEAREIALDIFKSNFIALSNEAADIATERATSFSKKFLEDLYKENESASSQFQSPAMQMALLTAQREYAKSGDEAIGDSLCNLLISRANETERSLKQLATEEAINIVPKLTKKQLDILTLNFLANDAYYYINSSIGVSEYVNSWLMKFNASRIRLSRYKPSRIYWMCKNTKSKVWKNFS